MACFTKTQQSNGTNCEFEKYVTRSKFFVLNTLVKSHRNSVRAQYVCDKSKNARVCAKWQWNALDWCYWIALPASPVVQSSNTVSYVSLSFRTHPCVLAILLLRQNSSIHQFSSSQLSCLWQWIWNLIDGKLPNQTFFYGFMEPNRNPDSVHDKLCYRKMSWDLEASRFVYILIVLKFGM